VLPRVGELDLPALEEHDRDIDASGLRLAGPLTETIEVGRVERAQLEPRLAVGRRARSRPLPGMRLAKLDRPRGLGVGPLGRLPAPQANEVVATPFEE